MNFNPLLFWKSGPTNWQSKGLKLLVQLTRIQFVLMGDDLKKILNYLKITGKQAPFREGKARLFFAPFTRAVAFLCFEHDNDDNNNSIMDRGGRKKKHRRLGRKRR